MIGAYSKTISFESDYAKSAQYPAGIAFGSGICFRFTIRYSG